MKRALILPALLLTLGVASCGSDDDDMASDTTEASAGTVDTTEETEETDPRADTEAPDDTEASTEQTTASAASGDTEETCDALRVISDYDQQSNSALAGGTDIEPIKQLFEESTPDVIAAYERVAAAEPDLADEAATLSDFTEAAAEASEDANDLGELVTAILGLPAVMEAGQAGVSLNTYAEENCGFSTGNQAS
jgi:hypothetical protein